MPITWKQKPQSFRNEICFGDCTQNAMIERKERREASKGGRMRTSAYCLCLSLGRSPSLPLASSSSCPGCFLGPTHCYPLSLRGCLSHSLAQLLVKATVKEHRKHTVKAYNKNHFILTQTPPYLNLPCHLMMRLVFAEQNPASPALLL